MENLRQLLAHCLVWQSWCRSSGDAAAAAESVYLCGPPGPEESAYGSEELRVLRPMAVVLWMPGFRAERIGAVQYRATGNLGLRLEADVPAELADSERDSEIDFLNHLGNLIAEMTGIDQGLGYLVPLAIGVQSVKRSSRKSAGSEGDYFEAVLSVEWGV